MPNKATFSIPPIKEFLARWVPATGAVVVDPFAGWSEIATHRNDIRPDMATDTHMEADEFCDLLSYQGVDADVVLFDPPYSPRQIAEHYKAAGLPVTGTDTQNAFMYKRVRDRLDWLLKPEGLALSFGWNSAGFGLQRGYEVLEILLVAHGGAHNDTICVAERKVIDL